MLEFPNISPIALELGPIIIRWYSLAYIGGILIGWFLIGKMNARTKTLNKLQHDSLMTYGILGIILGGRLGYVLFYNLPYFINHPAEILMVWQGGMSFHGGLIGLVSAIYLFCRQNKISFFSVMDLVATVAPIGLFFGRLANFINAELYGRVTYSGYGMIFPNSDGLPRYPSQLYEAALEGAVLFAILAYLFWHKNAWKRSGVLSGVFLIGYGIARIIVENYREPDPQIGYILNFITMGQILCLPMILLGSYLLRYAKNPNNI